MHAWLPACSLCMTGNSEKASFIELQRKPYVCAFPCSKPSIKGCCSLRSLSLLPPGCIYCMYPLHVYNRLLSHGLRESYWRTGTEWTKSLSINVNYRQWEIYFGTFLRSESFNFHFPYFIFLIILRNVKNL